MVLILKKGLGEKKRGREEGREGGGRGRQNEHMWGSHTQRENKHMRQTHTHTREWIHVRQTQDTYTHRIKTRQTDKRQRMHTCEADHREWTYARQTQDTQNEHTWDRQYTHTRGGGNTRETVWGSFAAWATKAIRKEGTMEARLLCSRSPLIKWSRLLKYG